MAAERLIKVHAEPYQWVEVILTHGEVCVQETERVSTHYKRDYPGQAVKPTQEVIEDATINAILVATERAESLLTTIRLTIRTRA